MQSLDKKYTFDSKYMKIQLVTQLSLITTNYDHNSKKYSLEATLSKIPLEKVKKTKI